MPSSPEGQWRETMWFCPGCGHWSAQSYLLPTADNPGWRPRCKMKGVGCSRPLMEPVEVIPVQSSEATRERLRELEVERDALQIMEAGNRNTMEMWEMEAARLRERLREAERLLRIFVQVLPVATRPRAQDYVDARAFLATREEKP